MTRKALTVSFDESKVDAIFAGVDQSRLPGVAAGIAIDGKPVYRKGFGLANIELPIGLSSTTRMRIFSATKQFTCLAYLLLCERGCARIDDPIGKYLPELHAASRGATIRQLMGHIGGLRDSKDISLQFSGTGRPVRSADLLAFYEHIDDVNFSPGTSWCYNNGGYLMLTVAIERIARQPFEQVLSELVFKPLGMYDTLVRRWDTDFVPNSATLHTLGASGAYERSYLGIASAGEGGIVSTVDDMLRWLAHMPEPIIGTKATWEVMATPQRLINGTSTGYGAGLMTHTYRGVTTLQHPGGGLGGNCQILKVPAADLDVVILANRSDVVAASLATKILDACLVELEALQKKTDSPPISCTFRSAKTGRVVELFVKGGEQFAAIDALDIPVIADDAGVLRPVDNFSYLHTSLRLFGDIREPTSARLVEFGNVDDLERVRKSEQAEAILGHYRAETTGTEAFFLETDTGPILQTAGRFGAARFTLQHLAPGIWRSVAVPAVPLGGILSFDRDGSRFRFSSSRTRGLTFHRVASSCSR